MKTFYLSTNILKEKKFLKNLLFNFVFVIVLFASCTTNNGNKNGNPVVVNVAAKTSVDSSKQSGDKSDFKYDLKTPDQTWRLPADLVEVSGNSWVDKDHLMLIEDLHPNLYYLNISSKDAALEKTIPFQSDDQGKKFDIEDVAVVNNLIYALWSHGILFKINNWNASKPDVKEIPTSLSKDNNTEGLCYDPVTKELLIACKDASGLPDEKKSAKAVYEFDMNSEKLSEKPFLVIHKKDFETLAGDKLDFNPSAIAIHPVTHDIYLLSTRDNKCMAVYSRDGSLKAFQFIDKELMPQPEGICFSPEGKLYISSEGKKGEPGNLFEFNVK
ncbi:MAG: SdiA-regulated domain-containing protein [Bacteroidota bacterium]|nr:SdiA-regulated domain-containing protein [Bacteroidota bacterium]